MEATAQPYSLLKRIAHVGYRLANDSAYLHIGQTVFAHGLKSRAPLGTWLLHAVDQLVYIALAASGACGDLGIRPAFRVQLQDTRFFILGCPTAQP